MTVTASVSREARQIAGRFVHAFNTRDPEALEGVVADDVEFRTLRGGGLRGQEGARTLLATAEELDIRLIPLKPGEVQEADDGRVVLRMPVRELVGPDSDIERVAEFEIRDGRVVAFGIRPAGA